MVWRSEGETISDRDARNIMILHTEHTDAFYVLSGVLRFALGPEGEQVVRASAGTLVSAPPGVAHSFMNDEAEDVTWLNIHTPDAGFAAFLRGARDGRSEPFDSFDVPAETGGDGGRPAGDAAVVMAGADEGMSYNTPELRVTADRFRVDIVVPGAAAPVSYCRI